MMSSSAILRLLTLPRCPDAYLSRGSPELSKSSGNSGMLTGMRKSHLDFVAPWSCQLRCRSKPVAGRQESHNTRGWERPGGGTPLPHSFYCCHHNRMPDVPPPPTPPCHRHHLKLLCGVINISYYLEWSCLPLRNKVRKKKTSKGWGVGKEGRGWEEIQRADPCKPLRRPLGEEPVAIETAAGRRGWGPVWCLGFA